MSRCLRGRLRRTFHCTVDAGLETPLTDDCERRGDHGQYGNSRDHSEHERGHSAGRNGQHGWEATGTGRRVVPEPLTC
jgi:hypothetical protein